MVSRWNTIIINNIRGFFEFEFKFGIDLILIEVCVIIFENSFIRIYIIFSKAYKYMTCPFSFVICYDYLISFVSHDNRAIDLLNLIFFQKL